jgi:hypothetical protein
MRGAEATCGPHGPSLLNITDTFDDGVADQLKWYVYVLADPFSGTPLYVGKGTGGRVFSHGREVLKRQHEELVPGSKLAQIRSIFDRGRAPDQWILRHGIETEEEALGYEAAVIDAYRLAGVQVANIIRGQGRLKGRATVKELNHRYGPTRDVVFDRPSVLYRINPFDPNWADDQLFERIRCCWPAAKWRRQKLQYAAAVSDYVIRAVYRIDPDSWKEQKPGYWKFGRLPMSDDDTARGWVRGSVRRLFVNEHQRNKSRVRMLYVGFEGGRR